jgi:hypothetical protein
MTEDQLQAKCFQWAWNTYPQTRRLLFSVPNGGTRNKLEAMKLKSTGLVPGVADMLLLFNGRTYCFEFKTDTGRQSPAQMEWQDAVQKNGFQYHIVKDFDYFCLLITQIVNDASKS